MSNVSGDVLELVLEYMDYHMSGGRSPGDIKEIAKPIRSLEMRKICDDPWDAEFADRMTNKQIFDIILVRSVVLLLACCLCLTYCFGK